MKITHLCSSPFQVYNVLPREHWCKLETEACSGPTLQEDENQWPYVVSLELGTCMVDIIVKNLKINSDILNPAHDRKFIPILYHMYTFRNTRQVQWMCKVQLIPQGYEGIHG